MDVFSERPAPLTWQYPDSRPGIPKTFVLRVGLGPVRMSRFCPMAPCLCYSRESLQHMGEAPFPTASARGTSANSSRPSRLSGLPSKPHPELHLPGEPGFQRHLS